MENRCLKSTIQALQLIIPFPRCFAVFVQPLLVTHLGAVHVNQISTNIIPHKVFRHLHNRKICSIIWEHLITELPVACHVLLEQNASETATVSPSHQEVAQPFPSAFNSIQSWKRFITTSRTYYLKERFSNKFSSNVTGYNDPTQRLILPRRMPQGYAK